MGDILRGEKGLKGPGGTYLKIKECKQNAHKHHQQCNNIQRCFQNPHKSSNAKLSISLNLDGFKREKSNTYIDTCQLKSVKERLWFQFDFNRLFDLFWPYFIIFIITFLILIKIITTIFIITSLITMLKWCRCGGATSSLKTDNQLIIARGRPHFCYVRMSLPSSSTCNILQYRAIPMHTQTNK